MNEKKYELIRSNRKTICIQIKEGLILVKAPKNSSISIIDNFVNSKISWIEKKLQQFNNKSFRYNEFLDYSAFAYFGKKILPEVNEKVKTFTLNSDRLIIPKKFNYPTEVNLKFINSLKKWYMLQASEYLQTVLNNLATRFNFSYLDFNLTNAATKWGSCSGKNEIRLNWRLVFLDKNIIDYVVIHELCHTVEHNHSKKFWGKVQFIIPNYKNIKSALKNSSLLIQTFRKI